MKEKIIPAPETLAAHEQAAAAITGLRKKGIHCHLEETDHTGGHCIDVVVEPAILNGPPRPERPKPRVKRSSS